MRSAVGSLRHLVRLGILLAIIAIPFIAHYQVFLARNQIEILRDQATPSLPRSVVLFLDTHLHKSGDAANEDTTIQTRQDTLHRLTMFRGNHWSAEIFGLSLIDPLAGLESVLASGVVTLTLLLALIIPIVSTVVLGRVFCSWICPAGFLFEMSDRLRNAFPNLKLPVNDFSIWRGNKYVLLTAGLALAFLFGFPLLGYFYPPALLGREVGHAADSFFYGLVEDPRLAGGIALSGISVFLFGILVVEQFVSRRMWCRYLCPGGALYALLGRWRVLRLKTDLERCTYCSACIRVCPVGLDPVRESAGMECDHCLECQSVCQPKALLLTASFSSLPLPLRKRQSISSPGGEA
jgi:ferredoxin-type protein NapH